MKSKGDLINIYGFQKINNTKNIKQYNRGNPFDPKRMEYFYFCVEHIVLARPFSLGRKLV